MSAEVVPLPKQESVEPVPPTEQAAAEPQPPPPPPEPAKEPPKAEQEPARGSRSDVTGGARHRAVAGELRVVKKTAAVPDHGRCGVKAAGRDFADDTEKSGF